MVAAHEDVRVVQDAQGAERVDDAGHEVVDGPERRQAVAVVPVEDPGVVRRDLREGRDEGVVRRDSFVERRRPRRREVARRLPGADEARVPRRGNRGQVRPRDSHVREEGRAPRRGRAHERDGRVAPEGVRVAVRALDARRRVAEALDDDRLREVVAAGGTRGVDVVEGLRPIPGRVAEPPLLVVVDLADGGREDLPSFRRCLISRTSSRPRDAGEHARAAQRREERVGVEERRLV